MGKLWVNYVSKECKFCGIVETQTHMILECPEILKIWEILERGLRQNLSLRDKVLGKPEISRVFKTINEMIFITRYGIFSRNNLGKWEDKLYDICKINRIILRELYSLLKYCGIRRDKGIIINVIKAFEAS